MSQSSGGGLTPLFVCARDVKFMFVSNAVKQTSVTTDIFRNVFIFGFCFNFLSQNFCCPFRQITPYCGVFMFRRKLLSVD
jgi:hypothetical protein